jgi:hypothetical protein
VVKTKFENFTMESLSKDNIIGIHKYIDSKLSKDEKDVLEQFFEKMIPSRLSGQFLDWISKKLGRILSDELYVDPSGFKEWTEVIREQGIKFNFENQREAVASIKKFLLQHANAREEQILNDGKLARGKGTGKGKVLIPTRLISPFAFWFEMQRVAGFHSALVPLPELVDIMKKPQLMESTASAETSNSEVANPDSPSFPEMDGGIDSQEPAASADYAFGSTSSVSVEDQLTVSKKHELPASTASASKRVKGRCGLEVSLDEEGAKHNLLQACLAEFDDILTDLFVDSMYLSFTTHKMSPNFEKTCKIHHFTHF